MIEFVKIINKDGTKTIEVEKSLVEQYALRGWKEVKADKPKTPYTSANNSSYYKPNATKQ